MVNFWKNAGIMATAELFLKLRALVMMPFITKYFGTVNYGVWSQVSVIVALVSPLVFLGMDNSIARFLPGKPADRQKEVFSGFFLFGLCSGVFLLLIILVAKQDIASVFFGQGQEYAAFVGLGGINVVSTSLLWSVRMWFRVQNNAKALVLLTVLSNLLQFAVLIYILVNGLGLYELVLLTVIGDFFVIFIYAAFFLKDAVFTRPDFSWLKPYIKFGIVLLPSGYAVWALNVADRLFLVKYQTLNEVGIYSIAYTLGYTLIQVLVNPIWSLFPTTAAELYNQSNFVSLQKIFSQSLKLICWLIFPAIFGFALVGQCLMNLITTEAFGAGYLAVPIILAGYLFFMLSAYFEVILALRNKPHLSTLLSVVAAITNVALNFLLIPSYSYMGAAIATALSFALQLGLSIWFASRERIISIDWSTLNRILFSALLMSIVVAIARPMVQEFSDLLKLIFSSIIGIGCYGLFTLILKIYGLRDFNSLRKLMTSHA